MFGSAAIRRIGARRDTNGATSPTGTCRSTTVVTGGAVTTLDSVTWTTGVGVSTGVASGISGVAGWLSGVEMVARGGALPTIGAWLSGIGVA